MFDNINLNDFWKEKDNYHTSEPLSEEVIQDIEKELGYKIPEFYIRLLRIQNGGIPKNLRVGKYNFEI